MNKFRPGDLVVYVGKPLNDYELELSSVGVVEYYRHPQHEDDEDVVVIRWSAGLNILPWAHSEVSLDVVTVELERDL